MYLILLNHSFQYYETHQATAGRLKSRVASRADSGRAENVSRIESLSRVQSRIGETLKDLESQEPPIHDKFNSFKGSYHFEKIIH